MSAAGSFHNQRHDRSRFNPSLDLIRCASGTHKGKLRLQIRSGDMKKTYRKPTLFLRDNIRRVTAQENGSTVSGPVINT